jgi:hypothetical protein
MVMGEGSFLMPAICSGKVQINNRGIQIMLTLVCYLNYP